MRAKSRSALPQLASALKATPCAVAAAQPLVETDKITNMLHRKKERHPILYPPLFPIHNPTKMAPPFD